MSPTVVPYGNQDAVAIFHTGTDNVIHWDTFPANSRDALYNRVAEPTWSSVPFSTTGGNVAVANPPGTGNMLIAYRGLTSNQLYSQWYDGSRGWSQPQAIPGAFSPSSPTLVWNAVNNAFQVFFRGNDNHVYAVDQRYGQAWLPVQGLDQSVETFSQPAAAVMPNGNLQLTVRDGNGILHYNDYTHGSGWGGWVYENTGIHTDAPPELTSARSGSSVWTLIISAGYVYWKPSYRE